MSRSSALNNGIASITGMQSFLQGSGSAIGCKTPSAEHRSKPSHVEVFRTDGRCAWTPAALRHARQTVTRAAIEPGSNTKFTINTPGTAHTFDSGHSFVGSDRPYPGTVSALSAQLLTSAKCCDHCSIIAHGLHYHHRCACLTSQPLQDMRMTTWSAQTSGPS